MQEVIKLDFFRKFFSFDNDMGLKFRALARYELTPSHKMDQNNLESNV